MSSNPKTYVGCPQCSARFASATALLQHQNAALGHQPRALAETDRFTCELCRRTFRSQRALQQHERSSPNHGSREPTSHSQQLVSSRTDVLRKHIDPENLSPSSAVPNHLVKSAFDMALRLRFRKPTALMVLEATRSPLSVDIVNVLIEGALRLLPKDMSEEGTAVRMAAEAVKARKAKAAEERFLCSLSDCGLEFINEVDQKKHYAVTPDVRFMVPQSISGHKCYWIEFKNSFGFRKNPFVSSSTKKQLHRYVEQIGPGAVVYKLGYEKDFPNIDGVIALQESEVKIDSVSAQWTPS